LTAEPSPPAHSMSYLYGEVQSEQSNGTATRHDRRTFIRGAEDGQIKREREREREQLEDRRSEEEEEEEQ